MLTRFVVSSASVAILLGGHWSQVTAQNVVLVEKAALAADFGFQLSEWEGSLHYSQAIPPATAAHLRQVERAIRQRAQQLGIVLQPSPELSTVPDNFVERERFLERTSEAWDRQVEKIAPSLLPPFRIGRNVNAISYLFTSMLNLADVDPTLISSDIYAPLFQTIRTASGRVRLPSALREEFERLVQSWDASVRKGKAGATANRTALLKWFSSVLEALNKS